MGEALLAGVDGGASRTQAVLLTDAGVVLGTSALSSSSVYHREPEEAAAVVGRAVCEVLAAAGATGPVEALGAGLAGADDLEVLRRLQQALEGLGLARVVHVVHDAAAALAGGTALEPGVVIIAGTGSVAFGVDAHGRRARAGGWGPLLADEGSGYAIGRAVLRAAMRAHDGRGEATALAEAVRLRFGLQSLHALKMAVRGLSIDEIAAVAPLASQAAGAGDGVAVRILTQAGQHLANMVAAVARALGWTSAPFPLIPAGGVFAAGDLIVAPMRRSLDAAGCPAALTAPRFPPEVGAALLAARAAGIETTALVAAMSAGAQPIRPRAAEA